ncbi:MAG: hypothetical protein DDT21_01577 [Syntrophomonadaceae bacterium]|nr:hypothetical protein [Bacillota bacterium]
MMEILLTKQAQGDLDAIEKKHRDKILAKLLKDERNTSLSTGSKEAGASP